MAFSPNSSLFSDAKEKSQIYQQMVSEDPFQDYSSSGNYRRQSTGIGSSLVATPWSPPPPSDHRDETQLQAGGQQMALSTFGKSLGEITGQFSNLNSFSDQTQQNALALWHQDRMNQERIKQAKVGAQSAAFNAVLGGVTSAFGAASSLGAFGGGATTAAATSPTAAGGDIWGAVGRLGI